MGKYNKKALLSSRNKSYDEFQSINSTTLLIKNIKTFLMSRVFSKQVYAIEMILSQLKSNSELTAELLINADITGLLCDVMNNHKPSLIQKAIICLLELSKNKLFYDEKHSAIVIETTSRTLKMLTKNAANNMAIFCGLKLLFQIISKNYSDFAVNLDQVMELLKNILFNEVHQDIHVAAMFLLRCVMRLKEFNSLEDFPLVQRVLSLISQLGKNNKTKFNDHIMLVYDIMLGSMRLASLDPCHPLSRKCEKLVWLLVQSCVVLFIERVQVKKFHVGSMRKQLDFLLDIFEYLDLKKANRLAIMLASKGFLTLIPLINLHYNQKIVSACGVSLLSKVLAILAHTALNLSDTENQLLLDGLLCLPVDANKWPLLLSQRLPSKVHYAVVCYLYFVLLCAKSFDKASKYLSVLSIFMKSQTSSLSPPMLKAVWFLFAVLSLSKQDGKRECKRIEESANGILVRWLQTLPLSTVYTHHPALLFWTFCPYVTNRTLQINLMSLWLKAKDKPSVTQTKELVLKNSKAASCILDVLVDCPSETIPQAVDILKTVLNRDKSQGFPDTSDRIWSNLPQTLSLLTTPQQENKVNNVSCVVFLACKVVPTSPDTLLLLRICYQLLVLLRRPFKDLASSTVLHAQLFKLATILVIKMNQAKDSRVLESFLQDEVLFRTLLTSLSSENRVLILPAIRLTSYLQYFQKLYSIKTKSCTYMSGATLLQLMSSPLAENKLATLNLFSLLHTTDNFTPVVALSTSTANNILLALYLDFQMMTLKTNESWRCQTLLLKFCRANNLKMELHLLTQAWTYSVIQLAITKKNMNSSEMLSFLSDWLNRLIVRNVVPKDSKTRALCHDRLTNTITLVAREVLQQFHCDNNLASLYVDIASKIPEIGVNVPQQVYQSLEDKIMKNYIIW